MTPASWNRLMSLLAVRLPSHQATKADSWFAKKNGLILPNLSHVDLDEPSSEIESYPCSFKRNDFSFQPCLPCFHRNKSWICLCASKIPCPSPTEAWGSFGDSADAFGLTSFLECCQLLHVSFVLSVVSCVGVATSSWMRVFRMRVRRSRSGS